MYGRKSEQKTKFSVGRNPNQKAPEERAGPTIPTLSTEVRTQENGGNRGIKKPVTASEQGSNGATAIEVNSVRCAKEPMLSQSVWCSCLRA